MFRRQTHNSSFIAYSSAPTRKPIQLAVAGEPVQAKIHPDVFINEYVSMKVKEVKDSGETTNVKFDAASVVTSNGKSMKYDFGANIKSQSPLHGLAEEALKSGRPVYAAIETRRRYKSKRGEIIPFLTPIHVLRGCENGPQSPGNSNLTGENCSKVIAAMGWADDQEHTLFSEEADSDPTQWDQVRGNQDGDIAPDGYVIPTGPNGEPVGGIIPAPAGGATGSADVGGLFKEIADLKKMVSHLQRGNGNGSGAGVKPWNERQGNGEINPASYAVAQIRHTRGTAAEVIAQALENSGMELTGDQLRGYESSLTRVLLWLADGVQQKITGGMDRMAKSYTEAGAWVRYVIDVEDPYTVEMVGEDEQTKRTASEWAKRVRTAATDRYREAVTLAAEHAAKASGVPASPQQGQEPHREKPVEATPKQSGQAAQQPTTLAEDQEARKLWDQLIEQVGMAQHVDELNPALTARFGTHLSSRIPAGQMREALSEWMASPQQFLTWAQNEWVKASKSVA